MLIVQIKFGWAGSKYYALSKYYGKNILNPPPPPLLQQVFKNGILKMESSDNLSLNTQNIYISQTILFHGVDISFLWEGGSLYYGIKHVSHGQHNIENCSACVNVHNSCTIS